MITPIQLAEFKNILREDYGVTLNDKDAEKLASDYLVSLEAVLAEKRVDLPTERIENDNQRFDKNEIKPANGKEVLPRLSKKKQRR